jgi:hypothetical protein
VIAGINTELKQELFQSAKSGSVAWVGSVFYLGESRELVPVRFDTQDYLVMFSGPQHEAGDEEAMLSLSSEFADGFKPEVTARVIKFCRADAQDDFFKPERWKLRKPGQIFQFTETLALAVTLHANTHVKTTQYFFWPASRQLEILYKRTFRHIDRAWQEGKFVPILESTGVFNGYQRT